MLRLNVFFVLLLHYHITSLRLPSCLCSPCSNSPSRERVVHYTCQQNGIKPIQLVTKQSFAVIVPHTWTGSGNGRPCSQWQEAAGSYT